MYSVFKSFHSYFAWAVLVLIILSVLAALLSKGTFKNSYKKIAKYGLISVHIQLLVGLILYFLSPNGFQNLSGDTMKDSFARLLAVEHPFINIVAIILITIGHSQAKKLEDGSKKILIFYGIGLILLLSRIPWSTWLG
ncbi:MAG: cytochrome B [Saprospiraceae bacterium]